MRIIRYLTNLKKTEQGAVVTIGSFDGVHLGHQSLISQVIAEAQKLSAPSLLISFEPYPREFFKKNIPARLTRLREKIEILQNFKLTHLLVLRFNAEIAAMSAEDFVKIILVKKLMIKKIIVGKDFQFGKDRKGDINILKTMGQEFGFMVDAIESVENASEKISSSRIRVALANANFSLATKLLGRPYWMCGRVIHGKKIGKTLGFPTVNMLLGRKVSPLSGIFIVRVHGLKNNSLPAVASLGTRPTIQGNQMLLEVYILDFAEEIYGRFLKVEFLQKIRDEEFFESLDVLREHIEMDVRVAREYFKVWSS